MKKLIALIISCLMMMSLVACGGENNEYDNEPAIFDKKIIISMYYPDKVDVQEIFVDSTYTSSSYNSWSFEGFQNHYAIVIAQSGIVFYKHNPEDEFKTFSGTYNIEVENK